jgi:hypothetical protein
MKRVFLSYAPEDIAGARRLYEALASIDDIDVWLDQDRLLPGMRWGAGN